jgi:hypothetical protein
MDVLPTPNATIIQETLQYRVFDGMIAVVLFACLVVGLPGNCLALMFFLLMRKRKTLSTLLYLVACSIDICSSVFHLPVLISLLNKRKPGPFKDDTFCFLWYFLLKQVQPLSMLVVMFQCVSRAIALLFPFRKLSKGAVMLTLTICVLINVAWTITFSVFSIGWYSVGGAYCSATVDIKSNVAALMKTSYYVYYCLSVGLPQIAVLLATLASLCGIKRSDMHASDAKYHQASVTISYYASIFLLCNSFTFVNMILYTITINDSSLRSSDHGTYPGRIYSNTFMFFYSWPLSEVLCTVLNAALNPVLYIWRMDDMRSWVSKLLSFKQHTANIH